MIIISQRLLRNRNRRKNHRVAYVQLRDCIIPLLADEETENEPTNCP